MQHSEHINACQDISLRLGLLLTALCRRRESQPEQTLTTLRDLLFQLPDLTDEIWQTLLNATDLQPELDLSNATALYQGYVEKVQGQDLWAHSLCHLGSLAMADGPLRNSETRFIEAVAQHTFPKTLDTLERWLDFILERRAQSLERTHVLSFLNRLSTRDTPIILSNHRRLEPVISKHRLSTIFVARIMHFCSQTGREQAMGRAIEAMKHYWQISERQAERLRAWIADPQLRKYDLIRISRLLYTNTSERDREELLEALFQTAEAQDTLSEALLEELLNATANLRLSHLHFQQALERSQHRWHSALVNSSLLEYTAS